MSGALSAPTPMHSAASRAGVVAPIASMSSSSPGGWPATCTGNDGHELGEAIEEEARAVVERGERGQVLVLAPRTSARRRTPRSQPPVPRRPAASASRSTSVPASSAPATAAGRTRASSSRGAERDGGAKQATETASSGSAGSSGRRARAGRGRPAACRSRAADVQAGGQGRRGDRPARAAHGSARRASAAARAGAPDVQLAAAHRFARAGARGDCHVSPASSPVGPPAPGRRVAVAAPPPAAARVPARRRASAARRRRAGGGPCAPPSAPAGWRGSRSRRGGRPAPRAAPMRRAAAARGRCAHRSCGRARRASPRPRRGASSGAGSSPSVRERVLELFDADRCAASPRRRRHRAHARRLRRRPDCVYVADTDGDGLLVFETRPELPLTAPATALAGSPYGIAADHRAGALWVTLTGRTGSSSCSTGRARTCSPAFPSVRQPDTVAVDPATGRVYVTGRARACFSSSTPAQQVEDARPANSAALTSSQRAGVALVLEPADRVEGALALAGDRAGEHDEHQQPTAPPGRARS